MARANLGNTTLLVYPLDGSDVSSAPTNKIPATSVQPVYLKEGDFGLKVTDAPISVSRFAHRANGNETIQNFYAGIVTPGSTAAWTVDLLKNGVSILSAPISFTNADPAYTAKSGTVASPSLVNGDVLTVVIVMTTNTGAAGPFYSLPIIAAGSPT